VEVEFGFEDQKLKLVRRMVVLVLVSGGREVYRVDGRRLEWVTSRFSVLFWWCGRTLGVGGDVIMTEHGCERERKREGRWMNDE
jgi:hypothetical protein